ncbi:MAG TPA: mechanosensitive ion channel domain-containing protein, partial [Capsulimonadaceae bacterium]|nr:mechanosensitive ion channel domain-containing protein [Capsulimonadaceae bacterium]
MLDGIPIFTTGFWIKEADSIRDICLNLLGVAILYIIVRFVLNRLAFRLGEALIARQTHWVPEGREARLRTLVGLIRSVVNYVLFFVFAIAFLRALRFDAISVATTASVAGLAFGFGAQKLVKDVISGFFIILENQYDIGDYVTINGITGRVEEIG